MDLPLIDEHHVDVAADSATAWNALVSMLPRAFGGRRAEAFARAVGCRDACASGAFPTEGSTIVGFRVSEAAPPRVLALVGEHRFARYRLTFRVESTTAGCRVTAESRGAFPGALGAAYRAAVIWTRMHVLVTRRMLRAVARRAERATVTPGSARR